MMEKATELWQELKQAADAGVPFSRPLIQEEWIEIRALHEHYAYIALQSDDYQVARREITENNRIFRVAFQAYGEEE